LVVIAIAGLVAAFVLAYKKSEWFRNGVHEAITAIKNIFVKGFEYVASIFGWLGEKWDAIVGVFRGGPEIFGSIINGIKDKFTAGFEKIAGLIDKVGQKWEKFKNFLGIAPTIPEPRTTAADVQRTMPALRATSTRARPQRAQRAMPALHAMGGIFSKPHMGIVAEGRVPESIIPHTPSGERIWQDTGEMAGFSAREPRGSGTVFSPVINLNVTAAPGSDGNEIGRQIIRAVEQELPRMLRRYEEQQLRVAY
jgi:hypothetical protein